MAQAVLRLVARSLDLPADYFASSYTAEPTILFRVFHHPPAPPGSDDWGVGQHTDYGLLTLLAQDDNGGLPARARTSAAGGPRWDGADPRAFSGTYGDYLLGKVSKVFPQLSGEVL